MSRIFLSHSSADNAAAVALCDWLKEGGWDDVFLDVDPERGIAAGERWERKLHEAAQRCEGVLFLVSRAWLASSWCLKEFELAHRLNKPMFGVLIEDIPIADLPVNLAGTWQLVRLGAGRDHVMRRAIMPVTGDEVHVTFSAEGLARLRAGLRRAGLDPRFFDWPPEHDPDRPPYRGLRPLEAEDSGIFYGREAPIVVALDRLRGLRDAAPPRLVVILGASGAGKSSFLRAGLLPRLARDDRNFVPLPVIRPEREAITGETGLVQALEAACRFRGMAQTRAAIREAVAGGAETLRPLLARLIETNRPAPVEDLPDEKPPLLVLSIDQGEELFLAEGADQAETLLALLRDLLLGEAPNILVLVTMRSDSYERMQTASTLEGLRQETLSLPPMPHGAYQAVIEGPPARLKDTRRALAIDPALTHALLVDIETGGGRDALPLLAFTLERLYLEYGASHRLALENYETLGRIRGSIEEAVERALKGADADPRIPRDREARLNLLRRGLIPWLAGIDPDTKSPRRRVSRLSEIPAEARPLIDLLVEQRLLATDRAQDTGEITIEPAHEALLRQWGLLQGWLEDDFGALAALEGVQRAARDWDANGRDDAWLSHRGGRLEEAEQLHQRPDLAEMLTANERDYLVACRAKSEAERKEKEDALRRDLKRARRFVAIVSVLFFIAVAGAGLAWWETRVATAALGQSETNYQLALDQAVGNMQLLADEFDVGNISSSVLRALVARSQAAVSGAPRPDEDDNVTVARIRLLDVLSLMEVTLGDSRAMQSAQDQNDLADKLKKKNPSNLDWLRLWSIARGRWSDVLYWQCDCVSAARRAREGADSAAIVLAARPEDWFLRRRMLTDYESVGDSLRFMGDLEGADKAYAAMLKVTQDALAKEPDVPRWLIFLAFTEERIGDQLAFRGKTKEAIQQFQDDLSVAQKLVERSPRSANYLSAVVQAHQRLGDAWLALGDMTKAMAEYRQYLDLGTTLAKEDQSNFRFQEIFVGAFQRLGDAYLLQKNFVAALTEFTEYQSRAKGLLAKDPANNFALYDLSNAIQKIGDTLQAKGDLIGALDAYRQAQSLAIELASKDCQDGAWQKNLAMSYQRVGMVLKAQGDVAGARDQFNHCSAIPVKPTVWSPTELVPRDVVGTCKEEARQLSAAH